MLKYKDISGFTFIELMTASVVLAIAVSGVYAAFLSTAQLTAALRHDIMAATSAQGALEQVRAERTWDNISALNGQAVTINWGALAAEVDNETAGNYTVADENLSGGTRANPDPYRFRRTTVTVNWYERHAP